MIATLRQETFDTTHLRLLNADYAPRAVLASGIGLDSNRTHYKEKAREIFYYTTYYNKTALQLWNAVHSLKVICPCMTSHNLSLDIWISPPNHENEKAMETLENEPEPRASIAPGVTPFWLMGALSPGATRFFYSCFVR